MIPGKLYKAENNEDGDTFLYTSRDLEDDGCVVVPSAIIMFIEETLDYDSRGRGSYLQHTMYKVLYKGKTYYLYAEYNQFDEIKL